MLYPALAFALALCLAWLARPGRWRAGLAAAALLGAALVAAAAWQPSLSARQTPRPGGGDPAISAEAAKIGSGTDALLARVSNRVRYEIYAGAFRGAAATLADGAGNDVDKALLLRDLLRAANPRATVRFATCTLPGPQIEQLIAAARSAYRPPVVLAQLAGKAAAQTTNAKTRDLLKGAAGVWTGVSTQNRTESARLLASLQAARAPLTAPAAADLRAIAASHTWVQLQNGAAWQDLDSTLPNAKVGAALCAAQSTAADLPDAAYTMVTARVRVERRQRGASNTQTAVEGTWRSADLAHASLTFAFAEPSGLGRAAGAPATPKGAVAYTPVLRADTRIVSGAPVYVPALAKAAASGVGSAMGGVLSAFGGAAPAPAAAATPDLPEPVGMWLQVTVTAPGTKPETVESAIFDRVGYADRAAGRAATIQLARLDDGHGAYLPFGEVWNVAVSAGTATAGAGDGKPLDRKLRDAANFFRGVGAMQRSYYVLRRALFAEASGAQSPPILNVRPGVSLLAVRWHAATAPSALRAPSLLIDIASDHAVPDGGDAAAAVRWGMSSLVAERLVGNARVMLTTVAKGGDVASVPANDVLAVFAAARQANVNTALVRSERDLGAAIPPEGKARLARALTDGSVAALVPVASVQVAGAATTGWWLINPDGSVRDEMQSGRHQAMVEEGVHDEEAAEEAPQFRKLGCAVRLTAVAIAAIGFAVAEGPEGGEAASNLAETSRAAQEWQEAEEEIENAGEDCSVDKGLLGGGLRPWSPAAGGSAAAGAPAATRKTAAR